MVIIIDKIITPYEITRYNAINKVLKGNLEVWFQKDKNGPDWKNFPRIYFKYKFLSNGLFNLEIIQRLKEYKNRIKRIICCGWDSLTYLYAFWFCKQNNIRFTLWSGSTVFEKSFLRTVSLPLVKFIISNTDDYIAYGVKAKEYLIGLGAKENRLKIFLNSVDVKFFHQEAVKLKKAKSLLRKKYNIDKNDTVLLYVGQLIKRKGLKELIGGFEKISFSNKRITLVIVGEGKLGKEIESFINDRPEVKIRLLGYLGYNKLPEAYALADVLILPSKEEVWGLVVNEALASGIPVLVSKFAGCVPDLVYESNGEIIGEISQKSIVKVIDHFLEKKIKYEVSPALLGKMENETYAKDIFAA